MLPILLASIGIFANFEGGNMGKTEQVTPTHLRVAVQGQADQDQRNRQTNWYYFRLENLPAQQVTVELTELMGEYNYRPAHAVTKNTRPVYSYDGTAWQHFRDDEVEWDQQQVRLRLRFTPRQSKLWIAHTPPYTNRNLETLLAAHRSSPFLKSQVVGKSVEKRDLLLFTITNSKKPDAGKKVIWLMFRQHAWESGTSWVCDGALRFLLSSDKRAVSLRDQMIFKIFPMADPDGVAHGGVRFNRNGFDLNRNWDTVDPVKMPEITAQRKALFAWLDAGQRIDLFLTLHNTESGEYVEGCDNRELFFSVLKQLKDTTTFNPTVALRVAPESTAPGKPGRMTVIQGLWKDRKVPGSLMEQMVEYNSKLGRLPTIEDRLQFGTGLVLALSASVID